LEKISYFWLLLQILISMKRIYTLALVGGFLIFFSDFSYSQTAGEWTWMKGDSIAGGFGVFGVQGVPALANHPPSLYETGSWTDLQGNFWLYGGVNFNSVSTYGDLWKYDVTTNMWTWVNGSGATNPITLYGVKGVAAATNQPGGRGWGMFTWTDAAGDLWLCGGYASGYQNDLWKYNIASNMWTWMSGNNTLNPVGNYGIKGIPSVNNAPGGRAENASAWVDTANNLWLFGGEPVTSGGGINDLWRYNISTGEWTWMRGDSVGGATPVFGTKGVSAASNDPGGRYCFSHWVDKSGNFYFFGGVSSYGGFGWDDLWKYDVSSNMWTWISGTNNAGDTGSFSSFCDTGASNLPGFRYENRTCWTDSCGNFWMMGGMRSGFAMFEDFWEYNPLTNIWRWISGSSIINQGGLYGTMGVSSPANNPPSRAGSNGWMDRAGNIWLFGGANDLSGQQTLNDLWRYVPDTACGGGCVQSTGPNANFVSSDSVFCSEPAQCINFFDHSTGNPTSWQWIFSGATPDTSTQQNPTNICYYYPGTYTVTLIVTSATGTDTLVVSPMITVGNSLVAPTITVIGGDTLVSSSSAFYQWYFNGSPISGAIDSFYIAHQGGTYAVQITDGNGCNSLSNGVFITSAISATLEGNGIDVYPNPASDELLISNLPAVIEEITIYDLIGEKMMEQKINFTDHVIINIKNLASGIYFIRISDKNGSYVGKFVKK